MSKLDNRKVAVAVRGARFSARFNASPAVCPYTGTDEESVTLRRVWLSTFLRLRPPAAGSVSYDGDDKVAATGADDPADPEGDQAEQQHQAAWLAAMAALLVAWPDLSAPMVTALVAAAVAAVEAGDVAALGDLRVPDSVRADLTAALTDAMSGLAATSAGHVVDAAKAQGVKRVRVPGDPGGDEVGQVAEATVGLIANGYASAAARKALQTGPDGLEDAVRTTLTDMGAAQSGMVAENLRAALSAAQNAGRAAVLRAYPPSSVRASERLDKNTCGPCTAIADKTWTDVEEALTAYPISGYRSCAGGASRCRGFLVPTWT